MRSLRNHGFTLLELMIVLAIIGILAVLAVPNFMQWIQDSKTRSVAESMQNGVRFALDESVRLSRLTTFTPTATGWTVDYIANTVNASADTYPHPLQNSPAGSLQGTVITPGTGTPAVLEFNNLGRVFGAATSAGPFTSLTADATYDVTNPKGPRKLRVLVSQAGKVRMCDPDKTFSDSTPDGC